MDIVKLGKNGQLSIPRAVLRRLGIAPETMMLVETTPDGGLLLKPAGVYPIEVYTNERLAEFAAEDRLAPAEGATRARRGRRR